MLRQMHPIPHSCKTNQSRRTQKVRRLLLARVQHVWYDNTNRPRAVRFAAPAGLWQQGGPAMRFFERFFQNKKAPNTQPQGQTAQPGGPRPEELPPEEAPAAGWDAITQAMERLYPGQKQPLHYAALVKWRFGGNDPLDGISIYDGGSYWHFVTYGFSELYEKEEETPEISGYGMEFTCKLSKAGLADVDAEQKCLCGVLQALARISFTKGEVFGPFEYIYTGQAQGIDAGQSSNITGFFTVPDAGLGEICTPKGRVRFVQLVGATDAELQLLLHKQLTVRQLYEKLGTDVTSYHRASLA